MDNPTRWCENDTGNETGPWGPDPKPGPFFLGTILRFPNCCPSSSDGHKPPHYCQNL